MIVNEGELKICNVLKSGLGIQKIILFQNNITVDEDTVFGDLTEATFSGYMSVTPTWGTPAIDGAGKASMTATPVVFAHNGGGTSNTIFGYAWVDASVMDPKIIAANTLATPKSMSVLGDSLTITPTFRDFQP